MQQTLVRAGRQVGAGDLLEDVKPVQGPVVVAASESACTLRGHAVAVDEQLLARDEDHDDGEEHQAGRTGTQPETAEVLGLGEQISQ